MLVNLNENQLNAFEESFSRDTLRCWLAVMDHWINTRGHDCSYPVTWAGLYSMLDDVDCLQVAEDLERALTFPSPVPQEASDQHHQKARLPRFSPQHTFTLSSLHLVLVFLVPLLSLLLYYMYF